MSNPSWRRVRLRDLLTTQFAGAWGDDPSSRTDANVAVLRSTNLDDEGNLILATGALRRFSAADLMKRKCRDGDLLLEASGGGPGKPVGRVALFLDDYSGRTYSASNFFRTLRPDKQVIDPRFLFRLLHWLHMQPSIWRFQQQTTGIINLRYAEYIERWLSIPDLREQRRIAEILDVLDLRVRRIDDELSKVEVRNRAVTAAMMADSGGQANPLGRYLQGRPKNGYSPVEVDHWTGVKALGLGCLTSQGFRPVQLKDVPASDGRNDGATLTDGDLLMTRANTRELVGLAGIYRDVGVPCIYPDLMMRLRCGPECLPDYLELLLQSPGVRHQIRAHAQGTSESMVKISSSIVMGLLVRVPSLEMQSEILSIKSVLRNERERLHLERQKVQAVRAGLMGDLLTGRVRV